MNSVRFPRATYLAAFLLGALVALFLVAPARSAESGPLDRIGVVRFAAEPDGRLAQQHAVLHDDGRLSLRARFLVPRPANTPDWILGRNLVPVEAWHAYYNLGYNALSRFELHDGGARVRLGELEFLLVAPNFETPLADGRLANLSTRARLGAGSDVAIVGFVVEHRSRIVLIRAVGPTLQAAGLGTWIANPFLSVKKGNQTFYFNDNWNTAGEADALRAVTTRVGAFPLEENSLDAARLIELEPGAYTIHVEHASPNAAAGEVLIEVYPTPADALP